jgi:type III secretion protein J
MPVFAIRRRFSWLVLAAVLLLCGCKVSLYGSLDEEQANEMVAILREAGLSADRQMEKDKTVTVTVEDRHFSDAVNLLKARGYPRQIFATLGSVFAGGGLVASPVEERAKMMYALSEELGRTISSIDGVLTARVHIVLAESDILQQNSKPSAASVFIRHASYVPVDNYLSQIKMLVANAVAGVTYDKVSVVMVPVEVSKPAPRSPLSRLVDSDPVVPLPVLLGVGLALALAGAAAGAVLRQRLAGKLKVLS